jgi:gluconokinase
VILIVAGVAGSGKTTVGALLAGRLRWRFADADNFHPEANIAKMHAGIPLTDADREPWLDAVAAWMDERIAAGQSGVVACSALKRAYRDKLLTGRPLATMIFLLASREVLERRVLSRPGHFFNEKLLDSQLDTLEPPAPGERVQTVLAEGDSAETAAKIIAMLWPYGEPDAAGGWLSPGGTTPRTPRCAPDRKNRDRIRHAMLVALALTWVDEADARPARHLQQGHGDREGAAAEV